MDKNLIKKKYKEKIRLFKFYNKKYYDENRPEVSDASFDNLKKDIINLENEYSFLKSKDSPQKIVGYKPSKNFKKVAHQVPMLSPLLGLLTASGNRSPPLSYRHDRDRTCRTNIAIPLRDVHVQNRRRYPEPHCVPG